VALLIRLVYFVTFLLGPSSLGRLARPSARMGGRCSLPLSMLFVGAPSMSRESIGLQGPTAVVDCLGNRTQAALRSILRLRSRGGMGWNGGRNHLQWRRGCIPCKDGFMHWLHMTGGATLFSSSSMGRFNNDIALWQGHF
jgi:hypothetical protein